MKNGYGGCVNEEKEWVRKALRGRERDYLIKTSFNLPKIT